MVLTLTDSDCEWNITYLLGTRIEVIENINRQIKSKDRITNHGEVFTADREVNAMLDLVKQETQRIDSRFLEPACGTGNFLVEILRRKLAEVENSYKKNKLDYEHYAVLAVSSIYGIDLLEDNIQECRIRLLDIFNTTYTAIFKDKCSNDCRASVKFILDNNIIQRDALTLQTNDQSIIFSEWSFVNSTMIKRREFTFHDLLAHEEAKALPLFSDLGDDAFIPEPIKEHKLINFLKLGQDGGY